MTELFVKFALHLSSYLFVAFILTRYIDSKILNLSSKHSSLEKRQIDQLFINMNLLRKEMDDLKESNRILVSEIIKISYRKKLSTDKETDA